MGGLFRRARSRPGHVHPLAVQALAELGIDASEQWSKSLDGFVGLDFDLVMTVCDHAAQIARRGWARATRSHGFPDGRRRGRRRGQDGKSSASTGGNREQCCRT
jgi:protein-tyrosine-phosphatase